MMRRRLQFSLSALFAVVTTVALLCPIGVKLVRELQAPHEPVTLESAMIGGGLLYIAALIAASNFFLSAVSFLVQRLMGWEYRLVSGLPVIGSVCLILALIGIPRSQTVWLAVPIAIFDTAGIPWLLLVMFLDPFLWAKPNGAHARKTTG
jgi:hypothetical protein